MLIRRIALLPLCSMLLLWLSSCGFTPMYGAVDDYDIEVATYLASIELTPQRSGEIGLKLRNYLEDRLNPTASASLYGKQSFRLEFAVTSRRDAVVIEKDGSISRFNILLTSQYRLLDGETREELDKGTIRTTASFYNAPEKFSAYVGEKDAIERGLREMSEDYRMRLAAYFASAYKLGPRSR